MARSIASTGSTTGSAKKSSPNPASGSGLMADRYTWDRIHDGRRDARSTSSIPPMEIPMAWAFPTPAASRTATTSSAIVDRVSVSPPSSDRPVFRGSKRSTLNPAPTSRSLNTTG